MAIRPADRSAPPGRDAGVSRVRIRVEGVVQGVGYRPFAHALATELGLAGFVGNDAAGVFAEVEGAPEAVRAFVAGLRSRAPALATVERVSAAPVPPRGGRGFAIVTSAGGTARTLVSADTATCADCLAELFEPADRRYRYPFVNCTNCGPRFTIVTGIPYDRAATTMAGFAMCAACAREYADPADRRFHAQPVCCPACGPRLALLDRAGEPVVAGDPVAGAAALLGAGRVLAVKGLGGYHLAADAASEAAVAALRGRKHREDKPFAVLAPDLATARLLGEVGPAEEAALTSRHGPIVLLRRHPAAPSAAPSVAPSVAPGNRYLGVLLPYTPLHHLLSRELARPLVLTSGNVSDEPIAYRDGDARERLAGIADAFLTHDRPIHIRTDDSVVRVLAGRQVPVRRSRGYVPEPLPVPWRWPRPVLACGAELKNTFCLAAGRRAFVSHHIGDLENYETLRAFGTGVEHFRRLFEITPELVAHDLHPEYLSTKYALDLAAGPGGDRDPAVELVGVQHHHAHIASCLADNGEAGPVIGIAFDGLGYGPDGTLWGGEILVADLAGYRRAGHLEPVRLPGGTAAIRQPWRMAAAYLLAAYGGAPPGAPPGAAAGGLDVARRNADRWDQVTALAAAGTGAPVTTSAGRLFDAVSALLGIRDTANYEGQAAVELEQRVDPAESGRYPMRVGGDPLVLSGTDLVRAALEDLRAGVDTGRIAARFHHGLAAAVADAAARVRSATGLSVVALSGGVFQNAVLSRRLAALLAGDGFRVLTHGRVPPNDGGISLGQAAVAGARAGWAPPGADAP